MCDIEHTDEQTQWHSSFYNAMYLRFFQLGDRLKIVRDYSLTQKALQIDVLVIKSSPGMVLDDPIGRGFKTHNVLEFKSPGDSFSVDDFYKLITYALLYKTEASGVDGIPVEDISITVVREERSDALISYLTENRGADVTRTAPGVYRVDGGPCPFAAQIVAYGEMDEEEECWLRSLSRKLSRGAVSGMASRASELMLGDPCNQRLRSAIESVAYVAYHENREMFARGDEEMVRIFTDYIEPAMNKARAEGISIGEARGIISMGRELGASDSVITGQLMTKLHMPAAEAQRMLTNYA